MMSARSAIGRISLVIMSLLAIVSLPHLVDGLAAPASLGPRGYLTSLPELARIKAQADKGVEPYASAVAATVGYADKLLGMARTYNVPVSYLFDHTKTNYPDWMCDMNTAAYGMALAYRLTGKVIYAEQARQFIQAIQKCRNMNLTYQRQAMLNVSVNIPKFVYAADLLEGWEGWAAIDRRQFQDWICQIAYPLSRRGLTQSQGNWHAWAEGACLAFADYCWDRPDLQFKSEDPNETVVFTAAEAWAYARQEFFNQANGYNGASNSTAADNFVLYQADILKKSMIRPDGGVPDELRREQAPESTYISKDYNLSHNYMGYHRDGLLVTCEIAYRRGDASLYENICTASDQHYVAETGAVVTLPVGRGSPREMLTFMLANEERGGLALSLDDGHKGSLEIFLRRYKDRILPTLAGWQIVNGQFVGGHFEQQAWPRIYVDRLLVHLERFRPIANAAWVPFTTLTHADPLGVAGEPPAVAPLGSEVAVPAAPKGLTAVAHGGLVCLSWYAPPGATSYSVKRSTTSATGYKTIATGLTASKYTDTGLTNGTTYYYIVCAFKAGAEGQATPEVSATPKAESPGTPPQSASPGK